MKILYLSHRLPFPPDKGDRIHIFQSLAYLSRFHEIHLIASSLSREDKKYEPELRKFCKTFRLHYAPDWLRKIKAIGGFLTGKSLSESYFKSSRILEWIRQTESEVDMVMAESAAMAAQTLGFTLPLVTDFVDMDSAKWAEYARYSRGFMKWLYSLESLRVGKLEEKIAAFSKHVFFVTQAEADDFKKKVNHARVTVLPNTVDLAYFSRPSGAREKAIVFLGTMDYFPNEDAVLYFYQTIWPKICEQIPDIQWWIVGREPSARILRLTQNPAIRITGRVDDVRPYLWKAQAGVLPIRIARGVQNKALEMMAAGLPVICTSRVAKGLQSSPTRVLYAEDDPEHFSNRVMELIRDEKGSETLSRQALDYVHEQYSGESFHLYWSPIQQIRGEPGV